jgi:hypothetical protein
MFCWNDPAKDVFGCIHSSPKFNITNIRVHLKNKHSHEKLQLNDKEENTSSMITDDSVVITKKSTTATAVNNTSAALLYEFFKNRPIL